MNQFTLAKECYFSGVGLHSGLNSDMWVRPAPPHTGLRFQRMDLPQQPVIEALADYVNDTPRGTVLCHNNIKISTLEHLMSAFFGLGIDNALVQLSGWEVPILDGSAKPYVEAFGQVGLQEQDAPRRMFALKDPIHYKDPASGTTLDIEPADDFRVQVVIDFQSEVLGQQEVLYDDSINYAREIAPCRTFVFLHEVLFLYRNNLVKGGDLDNALVIVERPISEEDLALLRQIFNKPQLNVHKGYLNNVGVHFPDECARHKTLDLLGDLMLAGSRIKGHVKAYKPGHSANTAVARLIRQQMNML